MFLHALTGALANVTGYFNPLLVGIVLTIGAILLRPTSNRSARSRTTVTPRRVHRALAEPLDDEEQTDAIRQRAVGGVRRQSAAQPPPGPGSPAPPPARRKPPRPGGGSFLLLIAQLSPT
jgi:hypothetical protein